MMQSMNAIVRARSTTRPVAWAALAGPASGRLGAAARRRRQRDRAAGGRILPDYEISPEFATKTKAKHVV
jgi:hypothetical protein